MIYQPVLNFFNFFRNLGINSTQNPIEQERIRLLNDTMLLGVTVELIYSFDQAIWTELEQYGMFLYRLLFYFIVFFFNYKEKTNTARLIFILLIPLLLGFSLATTGNVPTLSLFFIIFPAIVLVLLSKWLNRIVLISYVFFVYLSADFYNDVYPPVVDYPFTSSFVFFGFLGTIVFGFIYISRFTRANAVFIKRLEKLSADLEQQNLDLEANKVAIIEQQQALEKNNKELENFAYIASHDLKTPLRGITSFLNLIQRKLKNHPNEEIHEYLEFASNSTKKMHYLVEDILEFSRLGDKSMTISQVDLNQICMIVSKNLTDLLANTKGDIIVQNELPKVMANETQMMILLQNLVENGLKYNNSDKPIVTIVSRSDNENLIIDVKDNGLGIPDKYFEEIFKMFQRLLKESEYQGSGVGLAICKKIVEQYDGTISVRNRSQGGTTFTIKVPRNHVKND